MATIEVDEPEVPGAIKRTAQERGGDVSLSVFCHGALAGWGLEMYEQLGGDDRGAG